MIEKKEKSTNLKLAMDWLTRCQEITGCGGLSAYYVPILRKWAPAYPETIGYAIPTFYNYSNLYSENKIFEKRAFKMAEWLPNLQNPEGSFPTWALRKNEGTAKPVSLD